jgi:hypothetical protein
MIIVTVLVMGQQSHLFFSPFFAFVCVLCSRLQRDRNPSPPHTHTYTKGDLLKGVRSTVKGKRGKQNGAVMQIPASTISPPLFGRVFLSFFFLFFWRLQER